MNKTYMMEIDKSLDTLQQSFKSMQFSHIDIQGLLGIKDKFTIDYKDIHETMTYNYEEFDQEYGKHIENMHLYNGLAFVKRGLDKQVRPEIFISGNPVFGAEMTSLSYTNYGLQDYINLIARLKNKQFLRIDDKVYRDLIYRQFLAFHIYNRVNPFNSIEEFFTTAISGVLSSVTVVGETPELWCFKTYTPVFKDSVISKMNAETQATFGKDRFGLKEQYLKVKNFDHFNVLCETSVKNIEKREFTPDEKDNAEITGYYMGFYSMQIVNWGEHPKKDDLFFEEVFKDNAYEAIMHEFVEKTKLHLVTA